MHQVNTQTQLRSSNVPLLLVHFTCFSEKLFQRHADLLVSEGYADAGYEYVIIDDCWLEKNRDNDTQKLVPDRKRFPNGLNALSDHVISNI